jgi:subtilisin family serine protease
MARGPARRVVGLVLALAAFVALAAVPTARGAAGPGSGPLVRVIVREAPGAGAAPERLVAALGGTVGHRLSIIDGFTAAVPTGGLQRLATGAGVRSVSHDQQVTMAASTYAPATDRGSMYHVATTTGASSAMWPSGYTGKGVDVALIDSGVTQVNGLRKPGKVVYGPDLSFESQSPDLRYLDTFGHGTHMAGIIAGRDDQVTAVTAAQARDNFMGVAPDARIVSVKVADAGGATDVSQVIAAIDWVVQHRRSNGLNIRVLNLSFGTDAAQPYTIDPLASAAEVAWRNGIVVVVSGGNAGYGSVQLNNPAYDPHVLAVGAEGTKGTATTADDDVPSFSFTGDWQRAPDLVAPGKSIVSLAVPGSLLDTQYPAGREGTRFFRGSGTSQAAAVVSGAAALLLQQRPGATPDEVKSILKNSTTWLNYSGDYRAQGMGALDLAKARSKATPTGETQGWNRSTATGTLDGARGSVKLVNSGVTLGGQRDIFGGTVDLARWKAGAGSSNWSGGNWNGSRWTGDGWSGSRWTAATWTGSSWSGSAWTSVNWSGSRWTGSRWTGTALTGSRWTGSRWTGDTWSSAGWGD